MGIITLLGVIMELRLFFEPHKQMKINDGDIFKYYAENYLSDFNATFGNYIAMNVMDKVHGRLEPVWQFIMSDTTEKEERRLIKYITDNPMNGYHIHIYKKTPNENFHKVH